MFFKSEPISFYHVLCALPLCVIENSEQCYISNLSIWSSKLLYVCHWQFNDHCSIVINGDFNPGLSHVQSTHKDGLIGKLHGHIYPSFCILGHITANHLL